MGEDKSSVLYYNGRPLLNISEMPPITFDSCVDGGDIIGTFPQNIQTFKNEPQEICS